MMNQRNETIDIMKGIGIITVIIGHMGSITYMPYRHVIFSFHMPLFFILAGYFFKPNPNFTDKIKKDFSRLVIPYIFTAIILIFYNVVKYYVGEVKDVNIILNECLAAFYGSGSTHSSMFFGKVPEIGAIWFLMALFWCRVTYNVIACKSRHKYLIAGFIAILATLIDRYIINLPFTILPGLSAMMFYLIGDWFKEYKVSFILIVVCLACWVISIISSRIVMVICHYELYPIDVLGACGGTLFIYWISAFLAKTKMKSLLVWLGVNSLVIFCFHLIELKHNLCGHLHIPFVFYYELPVKLLFCVVMTWLCYKFEFTRRVFALKK